MGAMVLNITKRDRRTIRIGPEIVVKVLRIEGSTKAMLRIEAPRDLKIELVADIIVDPDEHESQHVAPEGGSV